MRWKKNKMLVKKEAGLSKSDHQLVRLRIKSLNHYLTGCNRLSVTELTGRILKRHAIQHGRNRIDYKTLFKRSSIELLS